MTMSNQNNISNQRASRREALHTLSGALALPLAMGAFSGSSNALEESGGKIKIGQIGVGHAHASKLSAFRESSAYEVVGIVEEDPQLRERAQKDAVYQDLKWMTAEQLLNVPGLKAVLVETRVRDLLNTAEKCINAGKHIHLDKPAGESLPQFKRILDSAAKQKLLVQMGYMYRYNPAVVLMRDFLKKGWLGDATVRTSAMEVDGFERRLLVVCGTEGTFHIQPLDNPSARVTLSKLHDSYPKGYQDIKFPKYVRYVDDAADMARIIRGEKSTDFPYEHDLAVQTTVLQSCGLSLEK